MKSLRIGLLLGVRQIQQASIWTTLLIVFVMMLTFLNLIAVSGILVGLIEGAERAVKEESLGDIIISEKDGEDHILNTEEVVDTLTSFDEVATYSVRYQGAGTLEANYQERRNLAAERDVASVTVTGIDPQQEALMSDLPSKVVDGDYLNEQDSGYILLGALYTEEYAANYGNFLETVSGVQPGDTVRLTVGDTTKELTVAGIVQSKVDEVSLNTYIPEREFRRLFDRFDRNADEIVVRVHSEFSVNELKAALAATSISTYAQIQTYDEAKPKFITDIKNTFTILGNLIGSVGIVVASITIFIIVFINAISRRQQIGILKGIGIERRAIEYAYILQAAFYALVGSALGTLLIYGFLIGYFERNPIQFPFSDGILVAPPEATLVRFVILFFVTLIAGFIPAWMIARQNTLNSILGRK